MSTCAQQVAEALQTRLTAGYPLTGAWHTDRFHAVNADQLPDGLVLLGKESVKGVSVNYPRLQAHELEVHVVTRNRAVSGLDAALDAQMLGVLGAVFDTLAHKKLAPLNVTLDEIERNRIVPQADEDDPERTAAAVGKGVITLLAKYHTRENAPEAFC